MHCVCRMKSCTGRACASIARFHWRPLRAHRTKPLRARRKKPLHTSPEVPSRIGNEFLPCVARIQFVHRTKCWRTSHESPSRVSYEVSEWVQNGAAYANR